MKTNQIANDNVPVDFFANLHVKLSKVDENLAKFFNSLIDLSAEADWIMLFVEV